jgi:DEAD/DEAH box helicase domain-containing protein
VNPFLVADELRLTVEDYLRTTFSFSEADVEEAMNARIQAPEGGLFQGPFLSLRLPYRQEDEGAELPLDLRLRFPRPYIHQVNAWRCLSSKQSGPARHALITTGTGSGKSECFLAPILDHCLRLKEVQGIKAIILYPMNALASDQARRLANWVHEDQALRNQVSVGLYVGGVGGTQDHGGHGARQMSPESVITDRKELRLRPPDILLTNYKMLDFLLQRPDDRDLWRGCGSEDLRFLVLDELHSYDGAQGSDVACLIRRLKARLGCLPGSLSCVGTSATMGGDPKQASKKLRTFAGKIFGEHFPEESVIGEERTRVEDLPFHPNETTRPAPSRALDPIPEETDEEFARRQVNLWFPEMATVQPPPGPLEAGARLEGHPFTRDILHHLGNKTMALEELCKTLSRRAVELLGHAPQDQRRLLVSFLSLLSWARRPQENGSAPLLQIQVQLWVREFSRVSREVQDPPALFWRDERPRDEAPRGLVPIYCRTCGQDGWMGIRRDEDQILGDDSREIYRAYTHRSPDLRYLFRGQAPPDSAQQLFSGTVDPETLRLLPSTSEEAQGLTNLYEFRRLSEGKGRGRDQRRCPSCASDQSLGIVGSRGASLLSVLVGHLFATPKNRDRKLLVFTDSVQDAAHRAGYLSARTYRFILRSAIQSAIQEHFQKHPSQSLTLADLPQRVIQGESKRLGEKAARAALLPADLKDHANLSKDDLNSRLAWEIGAEFGFRARQGRTLDPVLFTHACG